LLGLSSIFQSSAKERRKGKKGHTRATTEEQATSCCSCQDCRLAFLKLFAINAMIWPLFACVEC